MMKDKLLVGYLAGIIGLGVLFVSYTFAFADCNIPSYVPNADTPSDNIQNYDAAGPFTACQDGVIENVDFGSKNAGGLSNGYTMYIYTDNAGEPGTQVGGSDSLQPTNTDCAANTWHFSTPVNVTNGTDYWVVIHSDIDGNNYPDILTSCSDGVGGGGTAYKSTDAITWNNNGPAEYATFDILDEPTPPTPDISTEATSTVDQTEQNLWFAYWTFFGTMIFVIWLFRSTRT